MHSVFFGKTGVTTKNLPQKCYAPKPNPLKNKLETTPDPPIFPHSTNDFRKPIMFKSDLGNVFFGKESEKSSGEKPSEQPHPKSKPKLVRFHCDYCGREGHKGKFFFKRKREERMAKEWANKDRYNPSHALPEPHMPLPRGKAVVRSVPAWGDVSSHSRGGLLERAVRPAGRGGQTGPTQRGAVRLAWLGGQTAHRILGGSIFEVMIRVVSVLVVVVLVVGMVSLQVVSLLDILHLVLNTRVGGVVALKWREGTIHGLPFMVFVLLQLERVGS
jgi:hypothetical protein